MLRAVRQDSECLVLFMFDNRLYGAYLLDPNLQFPGPEPDSKHRCKPDQSLFGKYTPHTCQTSQC